MVVVGRVVTFRGIYGLLVRVADKLERAVFFGIYTMGMVTRKAAVPYTLPREIFAVITAGAQLSSAGVDC